VAELGKTTKQLVLPYKETIQCLLCANLRAMRIINFRLSKIGDHHFEALHLSVILTVQYCA
jgi:uncharacterized membrane protein